MRTQLVLVALALATAATNAQSPTQLLTQANAAQQQGDQPTAIRDYRALLAQKPNLTEAHTGLGTSLAASGDDKGAIEQFQLALPRVDKKDRPGLNLALGLAYFKLNDFAAARQPLQAVLDAQGRRPQPDQFKAATLLANCDLRLNHPADAVSTLSAYASSVDGDPAMARTLGIALIRIGKFHDGAAMLDRQAEQHNDAALYLLAGSASLDTGEYEQARRSLERARHIDPQLAGAATLLGIARFATTDRVAAQAAFREALAVYPDDYLATLYTAILLLDQHNAPAAQTAFAHSQILKPVIPPALQEAAIEPSLASELEPAITTLQRQTQQSPTDSQPHRQLAALYTRLGRTAEAASETRLAAATN